MHVSARHPQSRPRLRWAALAVVALVALLILRLRLPGTPFGDDPALTPEAEALLSAPTDPYPRQENLYFALAGFDAPLGASPLTVGQARIAQALGHQELAARDPRAAAQAAVNEHPERAEFRGVAPCEEPGFSAWRDLAPRTGQLQDLRADNAELYARYLALRTLPHFFASGPAPSGLADTALTLARIHCLYLGDLVMRLKRAEEPVRRAALIELAQDTLVWRRALRGQGNTLTLRIAEFKLSSDYQLLLEVLGDPQMPAAVFEDTADRVEPLLENEDWTVPALQDDFRSAVVALQSIKTRAATARSAGALSDTFAWLRRLQRRLSGGAVPLNATQNLIARSAAELDRIDQPNPQNLAALDRYSHESPRNAFYTHYVSSIWLPQPMRVSLQVKEVWNLAALQRLARLGYEIRRQQVAPAALLQFLGQHPQWATHPATGRPFTWDASSGELCVSRLTPTLCGGCAATLRVPGAASAAAAGARCR
jgi:hypothetical protein